MRKPRKPATTEASAPVSGQVKLQVVVDQHMVDRVKEFCQKTGMSLDYLAACAFRDYLRYNQWMVLSEEDKAWVESEGQYENLAAGIPLAELKSEKP